MTTSRPAIVIGIVLLAAAPREGSAANTCGSTVSLKYYGGPIVQNPKVVAVFWGTNVSGAIATTMPAFYASVVSSSYLDWLVEYNTGGRTAEDGQPGSNQGISRGTFEGSHTITPSLCNATTSCTVSDAQVQAELTQQINAGNLPAPTVGCDGQVSTIYAVHFPVNVAITFASTQSCLFFCYYHNTGTYNGKPLIYTVNPDVTASPCAGACGNDQMPINNQTAASSAALFNAITDPDIGLAASTGRPIAWYDTQCGEIGAICDQLQGTLTVGGTTWTVQKQWSNLARDCVVTRSAPAICTGSGPVGCRPCSCADNGQDATGQIGCSGATPVCDSVSPGLTYGECIATGTGGAGGTAGTGGAGGAAGGGGRGGAPGGTGGSTGGSIGGASGNAGGSGGRGGTATGGGGGAATGGSAGGATGAAGGSSGGRGGSAGPGAAGSGGGRGGGVTAPKSGGCGCALGGSRDAPAAALLGLALGLAAMASRRRARRD